MTDVNEDLCKFCSYESILTLVVNNEKFRLCQDCCFKFSKKLESLVGETIYKSAVVKMDHIICKECGYEHILQIFKHYTICAKCGSKQLSKKIQNL